MSDHPPILPRNYTVTEAAKIMSISRRHAHRLIKRGVLKKDRTGRVTNISIRRAMQEED